MRRPNRPSARRTRPPRPSRAQRRTFRKRESLHWRTKTAFRSPRARRAESRRRAGRLSRERSDFYESATVDLEAFVPADEARPVEDHERGGSAWPPDERARVLEILERIR